MGVYRLRSLMDGERDRPSWLGRAQNSLLWPLWWSLARRKWEGVAGDRRRSGYVYLLCAEVLLVDGLTQSSKWRVVIVTSRNERP